MFDIIKNVQKGGMREEMGKETPKKMDNRHIFMTSHMTIFNTSLQQNLIPYLRQQRSISRSIVQPDVSRRGQGSNWNGYNNI